MCEGMLPNYRRGVWKVSWKKESVWNEEEVVGAEVEVEA